MLAAAGLLCLIAAHTILETARDALFLGKLEARRLPFVYVLIAGLSLVVSRESSRFSRRFGRRNALIFSLMAAGYGTALLFVRPMTPAIAFGLYLWSGLLGTVLVLQFWMFAGQLFTVSQGKRLFGPIAAGGVLGAVLGASGAAVALRFIDERALLLVSAAIFALTAIFLTAVPTDDAQPPARDTHWEGLIRDLSVFREQPYLIRVGLLVLLSTSAVLVTDYLFKSVAAASVSAADLGSFFAKTYAVLNAIALVVQVAITSRLVRRLGVPSALTVTPLLLAAGGTAAALSGGAIGLVLIVKGADGALRHSLHRVSSELSLMPLSTDTRDRAKPVLDTAVARGAQAATAGFILALSALGSADPTTLSYVVASLAALWLVIAISLRRPYIDLFRQALSRATLDTSAEDLNLASVEAIMEALSSRDPDRVLAAIDILVDNQRTRLIPALILYHESGLVLTRALEVVATADRQDWVPLAHRLLDHPDEVVRAAAVRVLTARGHREGLRRGLADPSARVRTEAAFSLVQQDPDAEPARDPRIEAIIGAHGEEGRAARKALATAIENHGDRRWTEVLVAMLPHLDDDLAPCFARAAAKQTDPRFIPALIARLSARDGRAEVRDAIVMHGEAAFDALERAMLDPKTPARVRLHIPRTLSRFESQRAVDLLTSLLGVESGLLRYKVLRGLGRLARVPKLTFDRAAIEAEAEKNLVDHLRLLALLHPLTRDQEGDPAKTGGTGRVLRGLLEDKIRQSLERAFRLLQIAHRHEDVRGVYHGIHSTSSRTRASALEMVEALTQGAPRTRELFRLVADELTPAERLERARALIEDLPDTYEDAVARLIADSDDTLAAVAAYHALDLGRLDLREEVLDTFQRRPVLRLMGARSSVVPEAARAS